MQLERIQKRRENVQKVYFRRTCLHKTPLKIK